LYFAEFDEDLTHDLRDDEVIPIEWRMETGAFIFDGFKKSGKIDDATIRYITNDSDLRMGATIRTSEDARWECWRQIDSCEEKVEDCGRVVSVSSLGRPPKGHRDSSWFQVSLQGSGYMELQSMHLWTEMGVEIKQNKVSCKVAPERVRTTNNCFGLPQRNIYTRINSNCGKALKLRDPCNCKNE